MSLHMRINRVRGNFSRNLAIRPGTGVTDMGLRVLAAALLQPLTLLTATRLPSGTSSGRFLLINRR
jgi:hypothetical protein